MNRTSLWALVDCIHVLAEQVRVIESDDPIMPAIYAALLLLLASLYDVVYITSWQ